MNTSELIQPRHLDRKAMIYVRQSSPSQVITNKESQRMQYAMRERAAALGWHEQDTNVIDADRGRSGTTVEQREGFQHLVAQIALDTVGILLAFDATRLARNCSHWYQLLDLCDGTPPTPPDMRVRIRRFDPSKQTCSRSPIDSVVRLGRGRSLRVLDALHD